MGLAYLRLFLINEYLFIFIYLVYVCVHVSMSVNMDRVPHRGVEVLGIKLKSLDFAAGAVPTEQSCQALPVLSFKTNNVCYILHNQIPIAV